MTPMPLIYLTDEQKQQLLNLAGTGPELLSHRAQLILAYAEGKQTIQAASTAGISRGRARFWKRQFLTRGMSIFESEDMRSVKFEDLGETESQTSESVEVSDLAPVSKETQSIEVMELPFPQPREKIGIVETDSLAEAGKKVWQFYFAEMLSHEEGTVKGENIEELHDMRVATRRMRSAFDIFGTAFDAKTMKRHLKGLRSIGRALGEVRDMDVLLENAVDYQNKLKENQRTGLEPLLAEWQHTIDHQRSKMLKHLQDEEYKKFKISFNKFLQPADPGFTSAPFYDAGNPLVRDSVPALVYSRYAAVRSYEAIIPTASVIQLHALRIEFKKLRYTLEYFREVLGEGIEMVINEIKQMQDHLGELHDADVARQLVSNFLKEWEKDQLHQPISERQDPEPVVEYLAYLYAERYRLVKSFPARWVTFGQPEIRRIIAESISQL